MSLEKAIKHGKEKRKRYYNSGEVDASCRPHGGCPYCEGNRLFATKKAKMHANKTEQENEFFGYWNIPGPEDALMSVEEELIDKMGFDVYIDIYKDDWSMQ